MSDIKITGGHVIGHSAGPGMGMADAIGKKKTTHCLLDFHDLCTGYLRNWSPSSGGVVTIGCRCECHGGPV